MIRIKKNTLLIYSFFQFFILASAKNIIGPLVPLIAGELGVGLDFIGSAISLSVLGLILVSLISGNLIELFGIKKVLFAGLILSFTGTLLLFLSHAFSVFIIAYLLLQLGIGIIMIGNLSIVISFYASNRASSLIKINYGHTLSFVVAPLLVSLMLFFRTDWRYFFLAMLIPQVSLIVVLWFIDIPKKVRVVNSLKTLFVTNKKIISNPKFILCSSIIFFYVSILNTFFVWFTSYFENINVGINISSLFLALFGLSIFLGMVIKNKLLKHFKERKLLFFGFLISFFLLIGVILTDSLILRNIFIFLFGINMAGNFTLTFSIGSELFPEYANSASGLMVAFAFLGVMVFQYLSGYTSEYWSKNSVLYINIALLFILVILTALLNLNKRFSRASS